MKKLELKLVHACVYGKDLTFNPDNDRLYMTSEIFKKILNPVLNVMPYKKAKEILVSEGLLISDPGRQLTKKVMVDTGQGFERKNMVILDASQITRGTGEEKIKLSDYLQGITGGMTI